MKAIYIDNCSHGYLQVAIADFLKASVATQKAITGYSGIRSGYVYLEEDCHASMFLNDVKAKGIEVEITESYQERFVCPKNYSYALLSKQVVPTSVCIQPSLFNWAVFKGYKISLPLKPKPLRHV